MDTLSELRKEIDEIDDTLLALFARRFNTVKQVGRYKKRRKLPVIDKAREEEILNSLVNKGKKWNINALFIRAVWRLIYKAAYKIEE